MSIKCPDSTHILIESANYGRQVPNKEMCPYKFSTIGAYQLHDIFTEDTNCRAEQSLEVSMCPSLGPQLCGCPLEQILRIFIATSLGMIATKLVANWLNSVWISRTKLSYHVIIFTFDLYIWWLNVNKTHLTWYSPIPYTRNLCGIYPIRNNFLAIVSRLVVVSFCSVGLHCRACRGHPPSWGMRQVCVPVFLSWELAVFSTLLSVFVNFEVESILYTPSIRHEIFFAHLFNFWRKL